LPASWGTVSAPSLENTVFDLSWGHFLAVAVVALIVIGPKELPGVLRTIGQWTTRIRRMAAEFQGQFQEALREAEMADLRKEIDTIHDSARGVTSSLNNPVHLDEAVKWEPNPDPPRLGTPSTDASGTDSSGTDTSKPETPASGPSPAEPSPAEPSPAEPSPAEPSPAEPPRTVLSAAESSAAESSKPEVRSAAETAPAVAASEAAASETAASETAASETAASETAAPAAAMAATDRAHASGGSEGGLGP
jgi:sec-independent protein translocase protein TatB